MFGISKKCPVCGKKCKPIGSCHYKKRGGEEGSRSRWYSVADIESITKKDSEKKKSGK